MSRCGSIIKNGIEIPENAIIKTSWQNHREYYVSGISENNVLIKFIDNGETQKVNIEKFNRYGY